MLVKKCSLSLYTQIKHVINGAALSVFILNLYLFLP